MRIYWLSHYNHHFPPVELASADGVLAVGGDLDPGRLYAAYRRGIFPWYNDPGPIIWHAPDPRFVLFPDELKVQKSMRSYFNQGKYTATCDRCFPRIMTLCAEISRRGQQGTWITDDMVAAYGRLHERGHAHSVEVWNPAGDLVGGLYGVAMGRVFFGESMFHLAPNASKFGFIALVRALRERGFELIDCQQRTRHLASLGARSISRPEFMEQLERWRDVPTQVDWQGLFAE